MAAEDFFSRWSKRKAEAVPVPSEPPAVVPSAPAAAIPPEPKVETFPTLDDVAALNKDSDFQPFLAQGIDENVKRSALKKLFSDPHFNLMDGLDTYIDDYSKFEPIPPEMLALLNHAKALLNPLAQFEKPLLELLETEPESAPKIASDDPKKIEVPASTATPEISATLPSSAAQSAPEDPESVTPKTDLASKPTEPPQGPA